MTSVKFFHSGMQGATQLSGSTLSTPGTLISILDACLVNGFNTQTATTVTVTSGIATMTFAAGHGFELQSVILVAGAGTAAINGEKRVLSIAGNTLTFAAPGVPDGTISGTITARYAPAGWEKAYSNSTTGGAYRSLDLTGSRCFYQFSDPGSTHTASYTGFVSMTAWNTGSGSFSPGNFFKSASISGPFSVGWIMVADAKSVYMLVHTAAGPSSNNSGNLICFGEMSPLSGADAYFAVASTINSPAQGSAGNYGGNLEWNGGAVGGNFVAARSYTGASGAVSLLHNMESFYNGTAGVSGSFTTGAAAFPNGPDTALILTRKAIFESTHLRGFARGLYMTPQNCVNQYSQMQIIDGQGALTNRKLMALRCGTNNNTAPAGVVFFDITGPWA